MQLQSGTAPLTSATALQATRDRCDELASLARAARDLNQARSPWRVKEPRAQLFVDVESLVNSQGEILNDIGRLARTTAFGTS